MKLNFRTPIAREIDGHLGQCSTNEPDIRIHSKKGRINLTGSTIAAGIRSRASKVVKLALILRHRLVFIG